MGSRRRERGRFWTTGKMAIITAILLAAVIVLGVWVVTLENREEPVQTVLYGRSGHYSWVPLKQDVEKNGYDFDGFSTTGDGFVMYEDGGRTTTMQGIDVSYYQGDIDWNKVAASGIEFAIIRMGYRELGAAGVLATDKKFAEYMEGAAAAGLKVGVYFFSQAVNVKEAEEEAAYVLNAIKGYDVTFPVVFDWEVISSKETRTQDVPGETLTEMAKAFCEKVTEAGYEPMVYLNQSQGMLEYDMSEIDSYGLWYAQYGDEPGFYYDFDIWQYSEEGQVDGIEGNVDLNLCFIKNEEKR